MKPFDERFADRVREVFDKHDEPADPAAWEAMQSRLGKGKARPLVPWLLRVAAALLLIVSFSVLLMLPGKDEITETAVTDTAFAEEDAAAPLRAPAEHEALAGVPSDPDVADTRVEPALADAPVDPARTGDPAEPALVDTGTTLAETPADPAMADALHDPGMADPAAIAAAISDRDTTGAVPGTPELRVAHAAAVPPAIPDDTATAITPALAEAAPVPAEDTGRESPVDSLRHEPDVPVIADAGRLLHDMPLYGTPEGDPAESRSLRWGVAAGPMLTYAEQQLASGMGFSAGASSEYRLSRQFAVTSGLLLAYQQFEVDNMPLRSRSSSKFYSSMPQDADFQVHQSYSNQSFEIMAVDIPVNIQYQLMETTRRQMYVEAGFSSLLYLQQRITGEEIAYVEQAYYSPADGTYRQLSSRVVSDVTASYGPFSRFDPARLLNLSFGYSIKGSNNTTIIEPFIKYPLGDIGSRQIRMGMGGINLRLRFGE